MRLLDIIIRFIATCIAFVMILLKYQGESYG